MYREHQPVISMWARKNPENLARVLQFCIISARQKFMNVPALIEEAGEPDSGALWGWKSEAFRLAWAMRKEIFWHCEDIWDLGHAWTSLGREKVCASYLLAYLSDLYGLNTAKAGFACQLAYGVSGCLDSVNTKRLNLAPRFCANFSQLKTRQAQLRRAAYYNSTIYHAGGTEALWDDWCAEMARRYPEPFPTAEAVSAWHLTCLNLD